MPLIDYVDADEVSGEVRDIVESGGYDKHSPYVEIRLNNPPVVKAMREYSEQLLDFGRVDDNLFELIMVAVAQANECDYCAGSHRENLVQLLNMEYEAVEAIANDDYSVLTEEQRSVIEFARQAATDPHRVGPAHIEALQENGYTDADIIQLLAIIGTCNTANMIVSSLNVLPEDREGEFKGP